MFAFNTTFDWRTNGTTVGLVVANPADPKNTDMW